LFKKNLLVLSCVSVVLTKILIHMAQTILPPASWEENLSVDDRAHKWKYAAGENTDGTNKTAKTHLEDENVRLIRLKDLNDRTEDEKAVLFKIDHPGVVKALYIPIEVDLHPVNKSSRARRGRSLIPPPASWEPHLSGDARIEAWKNAAGLDEHGKIKTKNAHVMKRIRVIFDDRVMSVKEKPESEWTEADHAVVKKEEDIKSEKIASKQRKRDRKWGPVM
jgi:hypothetical protein